MTTPPSTASAYKQLDEYAAVRLAPGEYLVLVPRRRVTADDVARMRERLPAEIQDRILVVTDMDAYVAGSESLPSTQPEPAFLGAGVCDLHDVCRRGEAQCPYHQALDSDATPPVEMASQPLANGEDQS
jgi:hypothetical protein